MSVGGLLIRADATPRMGTGHVMRGLALAQAWLDAGGTVTFAAAELPPALRERLSSEGCAVEPVGADAAATVAVAERVGAEWVVLDGYQFGDDSQQALRDSGRRVLAIDDYGHAGRYPADLVLNQNLGADEQLYAGRGPDTKLLLGPKFALLRREFADAAGWERTTPEVARKVLVTLGGADPDNVTLAVIEALGKVRVEGLEVVVVVGGSNPHRASLEAAATRSPARIDLRVNVTDMPALMRWADVAVAAGGTTSWERATCRLPGLILVLADNQQQVAAACDEAGLSCNLGWHADVTVDRLAARLERLMIDHPARAAMADQAGSLVDGRGAKRVVRAMAGPPTVRVRPVTADDARRVWEWANDPVTRAASFTTAAIPWENHIRWFAAKLTDPNCVFLIAEATNPVGQVRFDLTGDEAVISVGLAPDARGCGFGTAAIRAAVEHLTQTRPVRRVEALIRPENVASVKAFEAAGFGPAGETTVRDYPALRYVFPR
ncbi:MAG: UDP-2,4-diacetamido-2,4,6-trideoxy-beta-L-altropyranose hydrolase [Gemmataceae bacterium]